MNIYKIPLYMINKANDKLEQQCRLRPLRLPHNPYEIVNNDDILKLVFGEASTIETTIRIKGEIISFPAWEYHKRKMKRYKNPFKYLKKVL